MKKFLTALFCLIFLVFAAPLAVAGILNVGNIFGMSLALLSIIYINRFGEINAFIKKNFKSRAFAALSSLAAVCFVVFTLIFISFGIKVIGGAKKTQEKNLTLVVLGCQVKGEAPSLMLKERLDTAFGYLEDNPKSACVVSGGQGRDEAISEALCMYNYLVNKGIDKDRIYIEDKSDSTYENLVFSDRIIKENGLYEKIGIVTNGFHEYRANMIAERIGIESFAVSADTIAFLAPTYYVREIFALLYESFIRRWA